MTDDQIQDGSMTAPDAGGGTLHRTGRPMHSGDPHLGGAPR